MQCVLVLIAMQKQAFWPTFFVVSDANLAQFFFKEKCKSIVNGKKLREKHAMFAAVFITRAHFIWVFQGVFFLEWFAKKLHFVKYIYQFNGSFIVLLQNKRKSQNGDFSA